MGSFQPFGYCFVGVEGFEQDYMLNFWRDVLRGDWGKWVRECKEFEKKI